MLTTYEVDNYAGLPGMNGFDLGMKFGSMRTNWERSLRRIRSCGSRSAGKAGRRWMRREAVDREAAQRETARREAGNFSRPRRRCRNRGVLKRIVCENASYLTKTVIIATGAHHRKLGAAGRRAADRHGGFPTAPPATALSLKIKPTAVCRRGRRGDRGRDLSFQALQKGISDSIAVMSCGGAKSLQSRLLSMENVEVYWDTVGGIHRRRRSGRKP